MERLNTNSCAVCRVSTTCNASYCMQKVLQGRWGFGASDPSQQARQRCRHPMPFCRL